MITASNKTLIDIVRYYIDECKFTIPQVEQNFDNTKLIIYKVATELKIIEEMIIDKETEFFIAVRFPFLGLIIETNRKNGLVIQPIFKGKFFTVGTEEEQLNKMKFIVAKLSQLSNSFPVLTKIDVAVDIANMKAEEWNYKNFQFGFRARIYGHIETQTPDEISTHYIQNRHMEICIYNKIKENQKQKNIEKKEYYKEIFKDYKDITRIETRIKSEHSKKYTQAMLETDSLQEMAKKIMSDIADKRRIYNRKEDGKLVSSANKAKLLTEWEVWKKIREEGKNTKKIVLNDGLKIKQQYSTLRNVKKGLIETNFKNQKIMSKEELIRFIENEYESIEDRTKERLLNKAEHEKIVSKLKTLIDNL